MVIEVRDDGRGIDPRAGRPQGRRPGADRRRTPSRRPTWRKAIELLFHPGFSTAEVTSDISGRGVGMDVVRTTIRELGGEVVMTSEQGEGTVAQIRLPLTLAIMAALLVEADGRPFAIPLDRIERTVRLADHTVRSVAGSRMLVMRDGVLPIVDAAERFGGSPAPEADYAVSSAAPPARWRSPSPRSSASASWSPGRFRRRSPRTPRSRAPPSCPTARSP